MTTTTSCYDVVIIGAGPAGIFAALEISAHAPGLKILMLEKGRDTVERTCPQKEKQVPCTRCSPCAIVAGWGGAGAFSDGKLTLSPEVGGRLEDYIGEAALIREITYVDAIYVAHGAPAHVYGVGREDEISEIQRRAVLSDLKLVPSPIRHLGTGRTSLVLDRMKEVLLRRGVEIRLKTPVRNITAENGRIKTVITAQGEEFQCRYAIVAPGREGSEWLAMQSRSLGLEMAINPVDIGVRVELPAPVMEHLTKVVYESKFIFYSRTFDDRVRTFCMNPYGEVVQENNDGLITVNGHTHSERRTENTNFAILVSKTFTEPFKEPISYGKYVARLANLLGGGVIVQRLGDLISGQRSNVDRLAKGLVRPTLREATPGDLSLVFPYRHLTSIVEMLQAMDKIAPGVYSRHTLLYGVEVKFYSSRLMLDRNLETRISGLYAAGDGAGVTRGLAQASVAGVVAARSILDRESGQDKA